MSSSSQALIRHQEELSPGGCYLGAEATKTNRQPIRLLEGNRWPNSRVYLKNSDRKEVLQGLCPNSILLLTSLNLRMPGLANSTTPLLLCKKVSPKPKKGHRKAECWCGEVGTGVCVQEEQCRAEAQLGFRYQGEKTSRQTFLILGFICPPPPQNSP